MNQGKFVFPQLMALAPSTSFSTCVARYNGHYKVKHFTCWKQSPCMVFGQLTHRESLSDTMLCLSANADKLYLWGSVMPFPSVLCPRQMKNVTGKYFLILPWP